MSRTITAPKVSSGERAINAALAAGFEITRHVPNPRGRTYHHELAHPDGRRLTINTSLDATAKFINANGLNQHLWSSRRLAARSLTALERLLAVGDVAPVATEMPQRTAKPRSHRNQLSEQHLWALENEKRLRNDIRRERRQLFGR